METLLYSINDLVSFPEYVRDNGRRITITPESLFKVNNGVIRLVPKEEVPSVKKLGMDAFINKVNELTYMYTPFFYRIRPLLTIRLIYVLTISINPISLVRCLSRITNIRL